MNNYYEEPGFGYFLIFIIITLLLIHALGTISRRAGYWWLLGVIGAVPLVGFFIWSLILANGKWGRKLKKGDK